jgi:hypothetical protein
MMVAQQESVGLATGAKGIGLIAGPTKTRNVPTLAEAGIDKHPVDRARRADHLGGNRG